MALQAPTTKNTFDDCATAMKVNDDKNREDYSVCGTEMEQKCSLPWSPLERNKFSSKQRYVSCSRSVPRRNKRFVRCDLSRSLNFDANVFDSNSENSSFEENKHLSRSAKIMRALSFNSSPSYYGKTKIKKSLNFNLTPSPKRFPPVKKNIRKALSLNFSSPLSVSNKLLDFDKDPSDSANSSFIFGSSESIDENQNETPLRQRAKERETLHYSTPNTNINRKSMGLASFTPLLHNRLKKTTDNIVYITATPNSQSLKYITGSSKYFDNSTTNTSRNLFHEFHEEDDDRPQTPENLIRIIPESMSAIKRSHKKERSSKRSGHCTTQLANSFSDDKDVTENITDFVLTRHTERTDSDRESHSRHVQSCNSQDDMSDTGSLFDYAEELKSEEASNPIETGDSVLSELYECDIRVRSEENIVNVSETTDQNEIMAVNDSINAGTSSAQSIYVKADDRPATPELTTETSSESQKPSTPENRIHLLRRIAEDSIKKSHKKNKEVNKCKFFSPIVLRGKIEAAEERNNKDEESFEQNEHVEKNEVLVKVIHPDELNSERASTPEKINSSRLLLSQFSSVKKSHKKGKHNKILSGFLKRQEYFNKDMDLVGHDKNSESCVDVGPKSERSESMKGLSYSNLDATVNLSDSSYSANVSSDKLSPSKRKIPLDVSREYNTSVSCESELQELDTSQEEFKIFTPLKRKRSLISSTTKDCLRFYNLPSGKDENTKEDIAANISTSRCLTPILNFEEHCAQSSANHLAIVTPYNNVTTEESDIQECDSNDRTGRSTPKNMSTVELYLNLDSIKKSHKKTKRGNISRKGFNLVGDDSFGERCGQTSSAEIGNKTHETFDLSEYDGKNLGIDTSSEDNGDVQGSSRIHVADQNAASTSAEGVLQIVTPPNCLKVKNYIRLLRETSIKRSHKKVRDKKKHELTVDSSQLSDDGSIFGDEEESVDTSRRSVQE
ncbi:PREDICTED: uncharacterized protein LOC107195101 [Dufourea novaeangliae]|uniref:uncharacterized protein LOC107195101 n=1 Tax=Dufourea novaeangliae TaxID=178035 RepID=UPI0007674FA2|nr:PREDICTED: uncharacterized protein LOC107195101 [Dufourea novaeangliae]